MNKSIVALAFAVLSVAAWALPSTQDVEAAVQQGRWGQAESMMSEVVAAKPDSAKAHYVYAEMLAHNRNFAKAREEAARARQLDPAIMFTTPEKFKAFEQLLQREQSAAQSRPPAARPAQAARPAEASSSFPAIPGWVWVAGLAAIAFVLWRGFNRSRAEAPGASAGLAAMATPPAGAVSPGAAPGVAALPGTAMPGAAPGGGMLGTGMAVAGGVAGGMLLGEFMRNRPGAAATPPERGAAGANPLNANDAATQLENRPVDLGNGGDWDAGGSTDLGSGGADAGGSWD